ncbi:MAG: non-homologous end-joining DNA ligase [Limnochordales bacterium]|nr:non-homologous end-joining DNA ligase [Limnochordales bacterium]
MSGTRLSATTTVIIEGKEVHLTHLDKLLWPAEGLRKADLISYYHTVASYLLPHLAGRRVTVTRYPEGIDKDGFYQKHLPEYAPDWIRRYRVPSSDTQRGYIDYPAVDNLATLVWLANQAVIEFHPSLDRLDRPGYPDYAVFDLDPNPPATFADAREVALRIRDLLHRLGLRSYPKVSGATGLHIYVPLDRVHTFAETEGFVAYLGELLVAHRPDLVTNERLVARRGGRVYVDHMQNRPEKTITAVFSVRPLPSAPLSLPVTWDELESSHASLKFSLAERAEAVRRGPLFDPVLQGGQDLKPLADVLAERLKRRR